MEWREETEEETAAREAEWKTVYVRCRTCHFGSIETEFGEDQCPDCSSTMFVPVEPDYEAASKVLQSDESMTSWLMWATTIVDAALGIGGSDVSK